MTMQTLPLFALTLSALNVRKTERDADIAALAEDIAACGLKQNLVVVPAHFVSAELPEGPNYGDKFEVIAGGRRYQALRLLADAGRIEPDFPVPVLVEQREAATQTSLSENLHRVAMNPADEFEAFAAIVDKAGGDDTAVSLCAKRFGVTKAHVEGRLRLAALAPEVLEALRINVIGIESAKAYAITTDHGHQLKVFKAQEKSKWQPHNAKTVRDSLRGITLPLDHQLARFIGIEEYRKAGGRIEAEMFMGAEGEERLVDAALLEKLAKEWGANLAASTAKKDGFKDGLLAFGGYDWSPNWPKPPAGFEKTSGWHPDLVDTKKAARKALVGVYRINAAGDGMEYIGHFGPIVEKAEEEALPNGARGGQVLEDRRRQRRAGYRAGRIAVEVLLDNDAGPDLRGAIFWPETDGYISPVDRDDESEDHVLVTLQVRIPTADLEACREEALRQLDAETAAAEEEDAEA